MANKLSDVHGLRDYLHQPVAEVTSPNQKNQTFESNDYTENWTVSYEPFNKTCTTLLELDIIFHSIPQKIIFLFSASQIHIPQNQTCTGKNEVAIMQNKHRH